MLVAAGLVLGCKKSSSSVETQIQKLSDFASRMCTCNDKACAERVNNDLQEFARQAPRPTVKPRQADVDRMNAEATRYQQCMQRAIAWLPPPELPVEPAKPVEPPKPILPADPAKPIDADKMFASARTWASQQHAELQLLRAVTSYVDVEGMLDPEEVRFELELGYVSAADDPKRRTGAPVRDRKAPARCPRLQFSPVSGWSTYDLPCTPAPPGFPHCSLRDIWKRAIAKGAPTDAVAVVTYDPRTKDPAWRFAISDGPRGVAIAHRFADDCELVLEQPAQ